METTNPKKTMDVALQYVNGLKTPLAVIEDKAIGKHFIDKFILKNQVSEQEAVAFYHREKDNFVKRITQTPALKECTAVSIYVAFMQVGSWKLSFEEGKQADVYLIPGNRNIAAKGSPDKWIKEVVAQPSPYGEKKIRVNNGQIKKTSAPIVVRKGDVYKEELVDGEIIVSKYEKVAESDAPIVGGFIILTMPDGSKEYITYDRSNIERWKKASDKKNRGKGPNELYGSNDGDIDEGFFEGKMITHAFKGLPRIVTPKAPAGFVADKNTGYGFDVEDYETEETTYTEETPSELPSAEPDDFDRALADDKKADEGGITITSTTDDDSGFFA